LVLIAPPATSIGVPGEVVPTPRLPEIYVFPIKYPAQLVVAPEAVL